MSEPMPAGREPAINLPAPVVFLVGTLLAIYAGQAYILDQAAQNELVIWFAFIPLRIFSPEAVPGGLLPLVWTPVTHAFLHASWEHVLINSAWLIIFGTPVARRYGATRLLIAFAVTSAVGAIAFALYHPQSVVIMVGASGGIAGLTGLAARFIFQPIIAIPHPETGAPVPVGRRLATIREAFANTRSRSLIIVWLVLNAATPILSMFGGFETEIAWQAHIGGFVAGFFIAPLLEKWRAN